MEWKYYAPNVSGMEEVPLDESGGSWKRRKDKGRVGEERKGNEMGPTGGWVGSAAPEAALRRAASLRLLGHASAGRVGSHVQH